MKNLHPILASSLAILLALCMSGSIPALPVAEHYGAPEAPCPLSDDERAVLEALNANRRAKLAPQSSLMAIAREHAQDMAEAGYVNPVSKKLGTLEYRLARSGVSAAAVRYAVLKVGQVVDLTAELKATLAGLQGFDATHVGIGVGKAGAPPASFIALIAVQQRATLAPFPIRPREGQMCTLKGRLADGLTTPKLIVATPKGDLAEANVVAQDDGSFQATAPFDQGPGRYELRLIAHDRTGPLVTDHVISYVGVPYPDPPAEPTPPPAPAPIAKPPMPAKAAKPAKPDLTGLSPAQQLIASINAARQEKGLRELAVNDDLMRIAGQNCTHMIRADRPADEWANGLIKASRIKCQSHQVILFVSPTVPEPARLEAVLKPAYTDIGAAIVRGADSAKHGKGKLWGTVILMAR